MTATGLSAFGATLAWNGTAIAEILNISGPNIKVDMIDMTSHDSASAFREFVAGLRDGGEVAIEGNFIPGDTDGIIAFITDLQAGTKREVIITGPTAAAFTWTFDALGTDFSPTAPHDGKLGFTATLKVTGVPTLGVTYEDQLSALSVTTATLVPAFGAAVYSYTANTTGTSVTVTPTCAGADSIEVWADGVLISTLASGGTSSAIPITIAANVEIEVRCVGAGKMDRVYKLTLFKSA